MQALIWLNLRWRRCCV